MAFWSQLCMHRFKHLVAKNFTQMFFPKPPGHHYYLAIHICLYTGLRIGEALGLRWQDIDLKSGRLSVCGTMTESGVWQAMLKTKRSFRTIPFGEKLHKFLKQERKRQAGASLTFAYGT